MTTEEAMITTTGVMHVKVLVIAPHVMGLVKCLETSIQINLIPISVASILVYWLIQSTEYPHSTITFLRNIELKSIEADHYLIDVTLKSDQPPEGFPFDLPLFRNLPRITFHPKVTYLVGENGSGKSTLLEAIAVLAGMNPRGGGRNFYFEEDSLESSLHKHLIINRSLTRPKDDFFVSSESLHNLGGRVDGLFNSAPRSYGGKSLHKQSHGESFLSIISKRFKGNGLYILDEPEAALSPTSQFKFLALLNKLVTEESSQFIIATHSPIIMGYPNSKIYMIEDDQIRETEYESTPHFQLTKYFLNSKDKILNELLDEPPEVSL